MVGDLFQNSTKIFIQLQQIYSYSTKIFIQLQQIYSYSTKIFIQLLFLFNKNIHSTSTIFFIQQKYLFKNSRGAVRSFGVTVSTWMKISKNSYLARPSSACLAPAMQANHMLQYGVFFKREKRTANCGGK